MEKKGEKNQGINSVFEIGAEYKFIYKDLDRDGDKILYATVVGVSDLFVSVKFTDKNGTKELGIQLSRIYSFQKTKDAPTEGYN